MRKVRVDGTIQVFGMVSRVQRLCRVRTMCICLTKDCIYCVSYGEEPRNSVSFV